jgi:hypothetical protein
MKSKKKKVEVRLTPSQKEAVGLEEESTLEETPQKQPEDLQVTQNDEEEDEFSFTIEPKPPTGLKEFLNEKNPEKNIKLGKRKAKGKHAQKSLKSTTSIAGGEVNRPEQTQETKKEGKVKQIEQGLKQEVVGPSQNPIKEEAGTAETNHQQETSTPPTKPEEEKPDLWDADLEDTSSTTSQTEGLNPTPTKPEDDATGIKESTKQELKPPQKEDRKTKTKSIRKPPKETKSDKPDKNREPDNSILTPPQDTSKSLPEGTTKERGKKRGQVKVTQSTKTEEILPKESIIKETIDENSLDKKLEIKNPKNLKEKKKKSNKKTGTKTKRSGSKKPAKGKKSGEGLGRGETREEGSSEHINNQPLPVDKDHNANPNNIEIDKSKGMEEEKPLLKDPTKPKRGSIVLSKLPIKQILIVVGLVAMMLIFWKFGYPYTKELLRKTLSGEEATEQNLLDKKTPKTKEDKKLLDGKILDEGNSEGKTSRSGINVEVVDPKKVLIEKLQIKEHNVGANTNNTQKSTQPLNATEMKVITKWPKGKNQFLRLETSIADIYKSSINPLKRYLKITDPNNPNTWVVAETATPALVELLDNEEIKLGQIGIITLSALSETEPTAQYYNKERDAVSRWFNISKNYFFTVEEYEIITPIRNELQQ